MRIKVVVIDKYEWVKNFSENAHKLAFGTFKPSQTERIDYALLVVNEVEDTPLGYTTVRELSSDSCYMQFGGALPEYKGHFRVLEGYTEVINFLKLSYKRITTFIENTNLPMMKLAMKVGFKITGLKHYNGTVLLEHTLV